MELRLVFASIFVSAIFGLITGAQITRRLLPPREVIKSVEVIKTVVQDKIVEKIVYVEKKSNKKKVTTYQNGVIQRMEFTDLSLELTKSTLDTKVLETTNEALKVKYDTNKPIWSLSVSYFGLESTKDVQLQVSRNIWGGLWLNASVMSSIETWSPKFSIGASFAF